MHDDPADLAIFGPQQLPGGMLALGIALIVLPVAWCLAVWWLTRPRTARATVPAPAAGPGRRARYLERIRQIEARHARGEVTSREAHQALAGLLRELADEVTPHRPRSMTLSDLRHAGLIPLAEAIELYYPAEFAPEHAADLDASTARARELVDRWS